ncbi:hypothetical protein KW797_03840, partial [Candidatus Parcubacteria bacterium]|nr:hypothetical protein [Candidatus Parcubacteria bacterium]
REVAQRLTSNIESFLSAGGPARLQDENCKKLAEVVVKYHRGTDGDFLSIDELTSILQSKALDPETVTTFQFLYSQAQNLTVSPSKFRFWLKQTKELDESVELGTVIQQASQILEGKVSDTDGVVFSGSKDARAFLQAELARLDSTSSITVQPSGNIRVEMQDELAEVDKAERGFAETGRIKTGFDFVDDPVGGHDLGDFHLVGAFTSEGKTQYLSNLARRVVVDGWNACVITAETARKKYRRRIYVCHTHTPGVGVIGGVPYNAVKSGQWESEEQREIYFRTLDEFCGNPTYGVLDITQVSSGATIDDIWAKANNFSRVYGKKLHVLIIDYLALLRARRARRDRREEINEILQTFKELCLTFDNGEGVFGVAAHQIKQEARERVKPEAGKFYTVRDFSDTSEAGKSVDTAAMILRTDELKKLHEVAAGLVKNRDGDAPSEVVRLYEDFASSYLGNIRKQG